MTTLLQFIGVYPGIEKENGFTKLLTTNYFEAIEIVTFRGLGMKNVRWPKLPAVQMRHIYEIP